MREELDVRRLGPDDARALVALRREALESEPLAFAASVEDDRGLSLDFVRTALADDRGQAVFGHFHGADLAGMVGVIRDSKVKRRHTAMIWGMYVAPRPEARASGRRSSRRPSSRSASGQGSIRCSSACRTPPSRRDASTSGRGFRHGDASRARSTGRGASSTMITS